MSSTADLLIDGFGRVHDIVHRVLDGLSTDDLAFRPTAAANPISWLVWHLTRVQDQQVSTPMSAEERWTASGWADRFDLPFDRLATGYGQDPSEAGSVGAGAELLAGYHDDVHAATVALVTGIVDADLDRVIDTRWDPPVTLGVRLVSILADNLQHAGQAAYIKGLLGH